MLRRISDLHGFKISAKDGEIGSVYDFYFNDTNWTVCWIVIDTGGWLTGRRLLLPADKVDPPDWNEETIPVELTKEQIRKSPPTSEDQPVSRQHEAEIYRYYAWTPYWEAPGIAPYPPGSLDVEPETREQGNKHLRSAREVHGYHISALDGDIGHVEDYLVDENDWTIRYLIIDTRNWLPGKKVLVSPEWFRDVSWLDRKVHVDLKKETIRESPEYDPSVTVNREYEATLHEHYGRKPYWY